ncbi:MAG: hypothetical protein U1D55_15155 [Phycisphaerae bacterium]
MPSLLGVSLLSELERLIDLEPALAADEAREELLEPTEVVEVELRRDCGAVTTALLIDINTQRMRVLADSPLPTNTRVRLIVRIANEIIATCGYVVVVEDDGVAAYLTLAFGDPEPTNAPVPIRTAAIMTPWPSSD